jgi:hypothetical protein
MMKAKSRVASNIMNARSLRREPSRRSINYYDSRERPMSNPTLHHVTLKTTRLKEMIDWYVVVL